MPPQPALDQKRKFGRQRPGATITQRPKSRRRHHFSWKKTLKIAAITLGILIVLTGGYLGYKLYKDSSAAFGGNILGFLHPTKLNGEDQGRVNILLTGVSTDDPGHQGADLTDSIMIVSLDTKNNRAQLISIPRDLWVQIPGYGYSKINAANAFGDTNHFSEAGLPPGGMGLLEKVLTTDLQIPIQYYAKINYAAIKDAVNAVGGIDFTVKSCSSRGLYDPSIDWSTHGPLVNLSNGTHHLDGEQALDLARARGDAYGSYGFCGSDFDRTNNQRQMLIALSKKASSMSTLSNPVTLGNLLDTIGKNVKTNFKPSEVSRLYALSKRIDSKNIQSIGFNDADGQDLLSNYTTTDGESALIPAAGIGNYGQIQLFLHKLLSHDPVVREAAKVVILNGGNINGLASSERNILTGKGFDVVAVANAPKTYANSIIIDNSAGKKPASRAELIKLFGGHATTKDTVGYKTADFVIILGTNVAPPATVGTSGASGAATIYR